MQERLKERKEASALRTLKDQQGIDFISNDYLGYARLRFQVQDLPKGSTGSRLLSGNHPVFEHTEQFLAEFFGSPSALLQNSGYTANLGLISALSEKNSLFIYDALSHASVRDGLRLGFGNSWHFEHNDPDHLESLLRKAKPGTYVYTEAVFSMDGDKAPFGEILELCEKYGARLIVDEAHSGGIFGKEGQGLCHETGMQDRVFARLITFGKAYGRHGAVILGSSELREYLVNFSRPFIYSTALPPSEVSEIRSAVEYRLKDKESIAALQKNIAYWKTLGLPTNGTPICVIPVKGGNAAVKELEEKLKNSGLAAPAILSPTVPEGQERLRVCLHSFNTNVEMECFLEVIKDFGKVHEDQKI